MINDVFIINYEMLPFAMSWGTCQRSYYLAEHLINNGINATVIACKITETCDSYGKSPNFTTIFTNQNSNTRQGIIKSNLTLSIVCHTKKLSSIT